MRRSISELEVESQALYLFIWKISAKGTKKNQYGRVYFRSGTNGAEWTAINKYRSDRRVVVCTETCSRRTAEKDDDDVRVEFRYS